MTETPDPEQLRDQERLDEGLEMTFPASDPVSVFREEEPSSLGSPPVSPARTR